VAERNDRLNVSVVIPTWQRADLLERCVAATIAQEPPASEVLVVGRDEDEAAQAVVESFDCVSFNVRWIGGAQAGHIEPVKRGLTAASGDVVVFLDDDAEPQQDWLRSLITPFDDPTVGCVGGFVFTPGSTPNARVKSDAGQIRWYGKHVGNIAAVASPGLRDVAGVMEGNSAWRADILRVLTFDARLDWDDATMYGLDLALQASSHGFRVVYQPEARVLHHAAQRDPRLDRANRHGRSMAYSRNYTLIGLLRFRGLRRFVFMVWWWLIGDRGSPGLALGLIGCIDRQPNVESLFPASMLGKWMGLQAWLRGASRQP
jgi:GT2 family glycosyltransferase